MILGIVFIFAPQNASAEAPCPTGFSQVEADWWPYNNTTYFAMCNCANIKGTSASGSCSSGGGGDEEVSLQP